MELNTKIHLQLTKLEDCIQSLEEALQQEKNEFIRDSVIQRFEFTFEVAWKTLKDVAFYHGRECFSPRTCIRIAGQLGYFENIEQWLKYQKARNKTTHIYNESIAEEVYATAKQFVQDAKTLLITLQKEF